MLLRVLFCEGRVCATSFVLWSILMAAIKPSRLRQERLSILELGDALDTSLGSPTYGGPDSYFSKEEFCASPMDYGSDGA